MEFLCLGAIAALLAIIVAAYRNVGKKVKRNTDQPDASIVPLVAGSQVVSTETPRSRDEAQAAVVRERLAWEVRAAQVRDIRAREIRAQELQTRWKQAREQRAPEVRDEAADALSVLAVEFSSRGPAQDVRSVQSSADCWVPPGRDAKIGNRCTPGGMVYVGSNLPSVHSGHRIEPALIDPAAPREDVHPDLSGSDMGYWPSYSGISPKSRAGYLAWLEGGRSDPDAGLGLVFLFFYGLERRALHDAKSDPIARAEIPQIQAEVERLLTIYEASGSFRNYANGFLGVLGHITGSVGGVHTPRAYQSGYELPVDIRCAAGAASQEGRPIIGNLAFAWATSDPSISLRTPARRCRDEFRELFLRRYAAKHGPGLLIKPCKRRVQIEYRPASASFAGLYRAPTDLPDVASLVEPTRKLAEIVEEATTALEAYSRKLGRDPSAEARLAAAALLPPELIESHAPQEIRDHIARLWQRLEGREVEVFAAAEVLGPWLPEDGGKLSKKDAVAAASMLAHTGIGVEPDVRFGGIKVSATDKVAIFPVQPRDPEAPSASYAAATLIVHLAAMVTAADGSLSMEEEKQLQGQITRALQLEAGERRRLSAHVALLLASPPSLTGVKKRVETLTAEQRRSIGRYLVQVAAADGHIDGAEVTTLTKLFRVLSLDPAGVHEDLHAIQSQVPGYDAPVLVRPAESADPGAPVPPRPLESQPSESPGLDMSVIEAKLQESASVSALLSSIFVDEEPGVPSADEPEEEGPLDRAHLALLRDLTQKPTWSREEFEVLAEQRGLMPDGALDTLNDMAWDTCDEVLAEDGDPLEINLDVCKTLLST